MEAFALHIFDFVEITCFEDRVVDFKNRAVACFFLKQISRTSDIYRCIGNYFFAQGINRRIGYLGKELFEIVKQGRMQFA